VTTTVTVSLVLDLAGVLVFGLTAALLAARRGFDLFGIVFISIVSGLGGGLLRDVLIGRLPASALRDERYLICAAIAGLLGFRFHLLVERRSATIRLLDAAGLGFFAVAGTFRSLDADLGPIAAVLMGMITGIGGGIIRDLLLGESPTVLRRDIYALAAMLAAIVAVLAEGAGLHRSVTSALGITAAFTLRVLALRFNWQVPRVG
jgi:uncharacterized membrane protein YeiH